MDLAALRTVTLVARHGSFAAAARVLDVDPSSISRQIKTTETDLGLRLFQRSTRVLRVTEEGADFIARITPLLEEFDHAHDAARRAGKDPTGTLKMTAPVSFADRCILPHLRAFLELYPDVSVELVPSDTNVDLVAENIDLAIRLAPAPKGDLISTKLITTRYMVCAAPDFLIQNPTITTPQDLQRLDCLRFNLPDYRTRWRFRRSDDPVFEVPVTGRLVISSALSLRRAVLDGLGPALLPDWLVGQDVAEGYLINLFPDHDCTATEFDTGAWALYPSRAYLPQKVRVMIDFLRQRLR